MEMGLRLTLNFFFDATQNRWLLAACVALALSCPSTSTAQGTLPDFSSRTVVNEALDKAALLASKLEDELLDKFSQIAGWQCQEAQRPLREAATPARAIPMLNITCSRASHKMVLRLVLDASSADRNCRFIEQRKQKVEKGDAMPGRYSFLEANGWRLSRNSNNLDGCGFGALSVNAYWPDRESAVAAGPELAENLANDVTKLDLSDLISSETYMEHKVSVEDLLGALVTQTAALEAMVPGISLQEAPLIEDYTRQRDRQERSGLPVSEPPIEIRDLYNSAQAGWYYLISHVPLRPRQGPFLGTRLLAQVVGAPSVMAQLADAPSLALGLAHVAGCSVVVKLHAGDLRYYGSRGSALLGRLSDEAVDQENAGFVFEETEHHVAWKSNDGLRLEAVFENRVYLSLEAKGCKENPSPIAELFEQIAQNDFTDFGID